MSGSSGRRSPAARLTDRLPRARRSTSTRSSGTATSAEPYVRRFADFDGARGKRLLEIGVGLGTDFVQFVRAGAIATGVDLTQHGVDLVRRRLELEGLEANVQVADAESLPFEDGAFERVYSWGVLHHTPNTGKAIGEAIRVLGPGGEACVMLYARHSWVTYGLWARHGLLAGKPWTSLSDILASHMESEGTKGFTERELRRLFSGLDDLRIDKVRTPYDRGLRRPTRLGHRQLPRLEPRRSRPEACLALDRSQVVVGRRSRETASEPLVGAHHARQPREREVGERPAEQNRAASLRHLEARVPRGSGGSSAR